MADGGSFTCGKCEKKIDGRAMMVGGKYFCPACFSCEVCSTELTGSFLEKDGNFFCVPCYHDRFSPKCAECSKVIQGPVLAISGKNFCPECFVCNFCKRQIRPGEGLSMRGEKRCCAGCKPNFCACGCGDYCPETDRHVLEGIERPFRLSCLKCTTCKKQVYKSEAVVFNAAVYCGDCASKTKANTVNLAEPCAKCGKKIKGNALLALNKQWCAKCFACSNDECGIKLDGKFYDIDGMPYCKDCRVIKAKELEAEAGAGAGKRSSNEPLPEPPQAMYAEVNEAVGGEYAEVDDAPTSTVELERDYDNSEFSGSTPAPISARDHDGPFNVAEEVTYDNHDHAAGADPGGAGGGKDADTPDDGCIYDNRDAGLPPKPKPKPDPVYDSFKNPERLTEAARRAAQRAREADGGDAEEAYDNRDHAAGAVDVDALVQEKLDAKMRAMEEEIRLKVEREVREKMEAEAAAKAKEEGAATAKAAASARMHAPAPAPPASNHDIWSSEAAASTPIGHMPNPLYQSADAARRMGAGQAPSPAAAAPPPPPRTSEKDLVTSWVKGESDPSASGTAKFKARKDLPKPRTKSHK